MVILGLGSNLGDRFSYLRETLELINKIPYLYVKQVSPVYISDALLLEDSPPEWDMPYLNLALRCETSLTPHELLQHTKKIELMMGRDLEKEWGPRPVDIDILAWDNLLLYDDKLHVPHEHLHERPFALWPLADVAPFWVYPLENIFKGKTAAEIALQWGSRFTGEALLHTKQIQQRIDTPELMGIINITPDSFSNDKRIPDIASVIQHAHALVNAGADILDIGAEATGPNAISIDSGTEWQRLKPMLEAILAERNKMLISPKISIDTRHAYVAQQALALGVDCINDVSGLDDPAMCEVIAKNQCDIVIMHNLGIPANKTHVIPFDQDATAVVLKWAQEKLKIMDAAGISRQRIIFDIGLGFGKTSEQSLQLLQNIASFKLLNVKLLVGHSRKSFLSLFTDIPAADRDIETLPVSLYLAEQNIDILRLHNIDLCARALKITKSL